MKTKRKKARMLLRLARQEKLLARCEHSDALASENKIKEKLNELEKTQANYDKAFADSLENSGLVMNDYARSYGVIQSRRKDLNFQHEQARRLTEVTRKRLNDKFISQRAMEIYAEKIENKIAGRLELTQSRMIDDAYVAALSNSDA